MPDSKKYKKTRRFWLELFILNKKIIRIIIIKENLLCDRFILQIHIRTKAFICSINDQTTGGSRQGLPCQRKPPRVHWSLFGAPSFAKLSVNSLRPSSSSLSLRASSCFAWMSSCLSRAKSSRSCSSAVSLPSRFRCTCSKFLRRTLSCSSSLARLTLSRAACCSFVSSATICFFS